MARIFVSYKRKNKEQVFQIVKYIESQLGEKCWVDLDGIESSSQFGSIICKAIDNAEVVLFMHSSVHLSIDFENDWTIKELNYAQAKKKRVVLVKLDDSRLDNVFLLNYGTKNNIDSCDSSQLKKLVSDLKSWLGISDIKDTNSNKQIIGKSSQPVRSILQLAEVLNDYNLEKRRKQIMDKIRKCGYDSLTSEEKNILFKIDNK